MKQINILCTSVGNDGFPAVYRALKKNHNNRIIKIIGTDIRENAPGLYIADKGIVITKRENENHIKELKRIINEFSIDLFLPLSTEDQLFYAKHRSKFSIPIITSGYRSLSFSNDKYKLFLFLKKKGYTNLLPKFFKIHDLNEIERLAQKLGYPNKKVVFKFDRGTGAQGLKIFNSSITGLHRIKDRNNRDVSLSEFKNWVMDLKEWPECHIVEYLPGDEYSVDVLCLNGITSIAVVRKRNQSFFGLAIDSIVVDENDIKEAAIAIIKELNLSYIINVQFRRDGFGFPKLMEINPRIPGTLSLTIKAGINMPYLAVQMVLGEEIEIPKLIYGKRILRIWDGVFIET